MVLSRTAMWPSRSANAHQQDQHRVAVFASFYVCQLLKAIDDKGLTVVVELVGLSEEDQRRALRIMREGHSWAEVNGMLQVAQNCSYCNLPIKPTAADLKAYEANKVRTQRSGNDT